MPRGRRPIYSKAMTPAERQWRYRKKHKDLLPAPGSALRFRLELVRWVQAQVLFYPHLDAGEIYGALDQLADALRLDAWSVTEAGRALAKKEGWEGDQRY